MPSDEAIARINTLANAALKAGHELTLWYRVTEKWHAPTAEVDRMGEWSAPLESAGPALKARQEILDDVTAVFVC